MPVSAPIDNAELAEFFNDTLRPFCDRVQGLFRAADALLKTAQGRGSAAALGTTDADLFRSTPWTDADFAATFTGAPQPLLGTDGGGRTSGATNVEVLALLRLAQWAMNSAAADPGVLPLLAKFGPNPRV